MTEVLFAEKQEAVGAYERSIEALPVMIAVGSRAVEATLRLPLGEAAPYEYVVPESFYDRAAASGWSKIDGVLVDAESNSRLTTRYGTACYEDLLLRGRMSREGMVAGLPDVYAVMQYAGDTPETAAIRARLLDPTQPPLSPELLPREREIALFLLDQIPGVENDPLYAMALQLLTHAICTQYTLYGDPDIGQPNQIVGGLEKPENGTFAYYHNGYGLVEDSVDLLRHHENINAPVRMRLLALLAENYADIVYGNGREADNSDAFDELLSAELLYQHALMLGCPEPEAQWLRQTVLLTRFDEKGKTQPGRTAEDPYQRSVTASDLQLLARPGIRSSKEITFENMLSARRSPGVPLRQVMDRFGVWCLDTVEDLEAFTWEYRNEPVENSDGATLGEVYYNYMGESANFHENYMPPKGWTLDDKAVRFQNAADIREDSRRFLN